MSVVQVAIRDVMPEATVTAFECKCLFHTSALLLKQEFILQVVDNLVCYTTQNFSTPDNLKVYTTVNLLSDLYRVSVL